MSAGPGIPEGHTVCRYCRMVHPAGGASCPSCGAALDIRTAISRSGWVEQPPIKDMARIQFGQSRVQIEGTYVPVADFNLVGQEWIYFSQSMVLHGRYICVAKSPRCWECHLIKICPYSDKVLSPKLADKQESRVTITNIPILSR